MRLVHPWAVEKIFKTPRWKQSGDRRHAGDGEKNTIFQIFGTWQGESRRTFVDKKNHESWKDRRAWQWKFWGSKKKNPSCRGAAVWVRSMRMVLLRRWGPTKAFDTLLETAWKAVTDLCAKMSTTDVTAKTFFDRLYLVSGLTPIYAHFHHALGAHTPPLTRRLFFDFRAMFFPSGPSIFFQNDSPSNLAYPRPTSLQL